MSAKRENEKTGNMRGTLFVLSLALYVFSTYIGNDMIQPGMLSVVETFGVDESWVASSMTAYLAGGMVLQWLLGPLSDRVGRRRIMLSGVAYFAVSSMAVLAAQSIEQYILFRFFQGFSLCFFGAVGLVAVQEAFEEVQSVKVTALMSNLTLIAPLLGPLAGAVWLEALPWEGMFVLLALLAVISFWGLYKAMPETASRHKEKLSLSGLGRDYGAVIRDSNFLCGVVGWGLASVGLLLWIAQSPVILVSAAGLTRYQYGLLQIPVFGGLLLGNLVLARLSGRLPIRRFVWLGAGPLLLGQVLTMAGALYGAVDYLWLVGGLSVYAFGLGMSNAAQYRVILFSHAMSKGTVAAFMGMVGMLILTLGIEIGKSAWTYGGMAGFSAIILISGIAWLILMLRFFYVKKRTPCH